MSDKELSKDVLKVSSSAEINAEPVEEKTAVSVVKICGMTEAQVRTGVSGMSFKDSVDHQFESEDCGEVHIRLTGPKKAVKSAVKEIKAAFGINVFTSHEEKTLEDVVVELLLANKLTVSTVESLTGGMLAGRIINVPGVSDIYKAGFITYSNKAKRKLAGVSRKTIDKYGAVSEQTAKEMSKGSANLYKADVVAAVTGNAGPDESEGKPVGLVYIGVNVAGKITTREYHFDGDRRQIREKTVTAALVLMRECILEYYGKVTFGGDS